jgi:hypothetical protein
MCEHHPGGLVEGVNWMKRDPLGFHLVNRLHNYLPDADARASGNSNQLSSGG